MHNWSTSWITFGYWHASPNSAPVKGHHTNQFLHQRVVVYLQNDFHHGFDVGVAHQYVWVVACQLGEQQHCPVRRALIAKVVKLFQQVDQLVRSTRDDQSMNTFLTGIVVNVHIFCKQLLARLVLIV